MAITGKLKLAAKLSRKPGPPHHTFAVTERNDRIWSKAAALLAWSMEVSGNSVESAVHYTAWWCAMIGGDIGS